MPENPLSRRDFLKTLWISTAVGTMSSLPHKISAATCPITPIKGTIYFFMKGSFLDIQLSKNTDIHKNVILAEIIDKLPLSSLKPTGFPYSGANSSNWLFVIDLGCNPPLPLTLILMNMEGKKISIEMELFNSTRYVGIVRGVDNKILAEIFSKGTQKKVSLNLNDGRNLMLWQSGALNIFRPRGGSNNSGNERRSTGGGNDNNSGSESGSNGGCGPGGCDSDVG